MGFNQEEKDNEELQDKFISSLEIQLFSGSKYQFLNVLNALSLRVRVLD